VALTPSGERGPRTGGRGMAEPVPHVRANGVRFFVQHLGGGETTAVFVHGLVMDNLSSWWYTVATAAARRAEVVCYDLRGHGLSERPVSGYAVADSVADLLGVLDALGVTRPVHLVGNSYGGVVALAAAVTHPKRVASLVLVEAHAAVAGRVQPEPAKLAEGLDLAGALLDDADVRRWVDTVAGRKLTRMAATARELLFGCTLVDDLRHSPPFTEQQLAGIRQPTLLVYGERSDIFDRAELLAHLLPAARLEVVPGCDHTVLMSGRAAVRRLVLDWLAERGDEPGDEPGVA